MTYTELAIQKAIEGGYHPIYSKVNGVQTDILLKEVTFLDPFFWKSLGKSLGWKEGEIKVCVGCGVKCEDSEVSAWNKHIGRYNGQKMTGCDSDIWHYHHGVWEIEWHNFIDHLVEEKSAESFFKSLLSV